MTMLWCHSATRLAVDTVQAMAGKTVAPPANRLRVTFFIITQGVSDICGGTIWKKIQPGDSARPLGFYVGYHRAACIGIFGRLSIPVPLSRCSSPATIGVLPYFWRRFLL